MIFKLICALSLLLQLTSIEESMTTQMSDILKEFPCAANDLKQLEDRFAKARELKLHINVGEIGGAVGGMSSTFYGFLMDVPETKPESQLGSVGHVAGVLFDEITCSTYMDM